MWVEQGEGTISGLAASGPNLYVTGDFFTPTARFGNTTLTKSNTAKPDSREVFLAKVVDAGSYGLFTWAQQGKMLNPDYPYTYGQTVLAISGQGLYAMGTFPPLGGVFGSHMYSTTAAHTFLASLTDTGLSTATLPVIGEEFSLYPNPAHHAATVQVPAVPGAATATFTLLDALGRVMRTSTVPLPAFLLHELDLSGLPPGLYALQMQAGTATATRRLVIE